METRDTSSRFAEREPAQDVSRSRPEGPAPLCPAQRGPGLRSVISPRKAKVWPPTLVLKRKRPGPQHAPTPSRRSEPDLSSLQSDKIEGLAPRVVRAAHVPASGIEGL